MKSLGLFEGYGIELEYMIVDERSLDVRSIADQVLAQMGANEEGSVECGSVAWSNELAAHVIELKTNGPAETLDLVAPDFARAVGEMNTRLRGFGAKLMPTAMHPWMDPNTEFRLYPVDNEGYYQTFNRIFDCRGHGWSNLQSMHINLPFSGDDELARLHASIRLLLPLLPALAASSPYVEGRSAPALDHRLLVYRDNAARVPSVSGKVVPEHIVSAQDYQQRVLQPIYDELAPLDPEGVLRYEWVNARGCIARFDRMALEIRVLDCQECPRSDLAIALAVSAVLEACTNDARRIDDSARWPEARLADVLWKVARHGDRALLDDSEYLELWGLKTSQATAGELWQHLLESLPADTRSRKAYDDALWLVENGCLARRIRSAAGATPERGRLREVYGELCHCLAVGERFLP